MAESSTGGGKGRGLKRSFSSEEEDTINLKVKGQDGREVYFKIRSTTRLQKMLRQFCNKVSVEYATMRFYYDGESFPVMKTPKDLNMRNGDEIEAMTHCGGGGNVTVA